VRNTSVYVLLYVCVQLHQKYIDVRTPDEIFAYIKRVADLVSKLCDAIEKAKQDDDGYSYSKEDFCGIYLNETDFNRTTILLLVILEHTGENAQSVIVKRDDANIPNSSWYVGYNILGIAIATGNSIAVAALIDRKVDIDLQYRNQTPLFHAIKNIKPTIVVQLMTAGADINTRSLNSGAYCHYL
jgi:ankyrin repeat protein